MLYVPKYFPAVENGIIYNLYCLKFKNFVVIVAQDHLHRKEQNNLPLVKLSVFLI